MEIFIKCFIVDIEIVRDNEVNTMGAMRWHFANYKNNFNLIMGKRLHSP